MPPLYSKIFLPQGCFLFPEKLWQKLPQNQLLCPCYLKSFILSHQVAWEAAEKRNSPGRLELTFTLDVLRLIPMEPCAGDKGKAGFWLEGVRIQLKERLTR